MHLEYSLTFLKIKCKIVPSLFTVLPRFWVCKIVFWNSLISYYAQSMQCLPFLPLSLFLSPCPTPHPLSLFHRLSLSLFLSPCPHRWCSFTKPYGPVYVYMCLRFNHIFLNFFIHIYLLKNTNTLLEQQYWTELFKFYIKKRENTKQTHNLSLFNLFVVEN